MGEVALKTHNEQWLDAARIEILNALQVDYTDPGLLFELITIDLELDRIDEAKGLYGQFRRVGGSNPFIELVDKSHQRQPSAVAAEP